MSPTAAVPQIVNRPYQITGWVIFWKVSHIARIGILSRTGRERGHWAISTSENDLNLKDRFDAAQFRDGRRMLHRSTGQAYPSTATDLAKRCFRFTVEGRTAQGEGGNGEVATILIRILNRLGANWGPPADVSAAKDRSTDDVDVEARDGSSVLRIQVTRAEREIWRMGGRVRKGNPPVKAELHRSPDDAASMLMVAIQDKAKWSRPTQLGSLVLALTVLDSPIFGFSEVLDRFREFYLGTVRTLGFQAVWLVGPTDDLVHRLD